MHPFRVCGGRLFYALEPPHTRRFAWPVVTRKTKRHEQSLPNCDLMFCGPGAAS
nr:MAG TPA: hypothetical protein [Bacteriophage sp.]